MEASSWTSDLTSLSCLRVWGRVPRMQIFAPQPETAMLKNRGMWRRGTVGSLFRVVKASSPARPFATNSDTESLLTTPRNALAPGRPLFPSLNSNAELKENIIWRRKKRAWGGGTWRGISGGKRIGCRWHGGAWGGSLRRRACVRWR